MAALSFDLDVTNAVVMRRHETPVYLFHQQVAGQTTILRLNGHHTPPMGGERTIAMTSGLLGAPQSDDSVTVNAAVVEVITLPHI